MVRSFLIMVCKLRLLALLSTLWTVPAVAHDLQPAIMDIEETESGVVITLALNLEAYLSGIDLDGLVDTDEAAGSADYDSLRAMPPDAIGVQVPGLVAKWNSTPLLAIDGEPVVLGLQQVNIPDVGNTALTRPSELVLVAENGGQDAVISWPRGAGEVLVRQQGVENPFTGFLFGGQSTELLVLSGGDARSGWAVFASYIPVGFDHILPKGLDHILFVLGLFFLSTAWRPLLWQVTAFTAAHTVTLALGALGWVNVPGSIVEPLIAASIVYVAIENIFARDMGPWRPAVIFGFGLLHGLGFASVLGDFGLPEAQFVPALLGFNVGVELGQLTVIALAAGLLWLSVQAALRAKLPAQEGVIASYSIMFRAVSIPVSLLIALIGIWWVIERTLL